MRKRSRDISTLLAVVLGVDPVLTPAWSVGGRGYVLTNTHVVEGAEEIKR